MKFAGAVQNYPSRNDSSRNDSSRNNYMPENSEEGSVEAGLTFIPTTAFFLLVMQLVLSGSFQIVESMNLQSFVTKQAMSGNTALGITGELSRNFAKQGNSAGLGSGARVFDFEYRPLPGGGELILANSEIVTPLISHLIALRPKMKTQALAINE